MARQDNRSDDTSRDAQRGQAQGRDPERQEQGGKRLQADGTPRQQLGADTDNDLDDDARD